MWVGWSFSGMAGVVSPLLARPILVLPTAQKLRFCITLLQLSYTLLTLGN